MSKDIKEPDYSAIEIPLNAAASAIAAAKGIEWTRTIKITTTISLNEIHVGPTHCRLNPRTVVREPNLIRLLEKIFRMVDTLGVVQMTKKQEAIAFEEEQIKKKLTYLRRALHNGEYEKLIQRLNDFVPPPLPVPVSNPPAAPHSTSYEEKK